MYICITLFLKTKHQKFHSVRCAATNLSECVMTPPRVRFEISYFAFSTCEIVIIIFTCCSVIKNASFVIVLMYLKINCFTIIFVLFHHCIVQFEWVASPAPTPVRGLAFWIGPRCTTI